MFLGTEPGKGSGLTIPSNSVLCIGSACRNRNLEVIISHLISSEKKQVLKSDEDYVKIKTRKSNKLEIMTAYKRSYVEKIENFHKVKHDDKL